MAFFKYNNFDPRSAVYFEIAPVRGCSKWGFLAKKVLSQKYLKQPSFKYLCGGNTRFYITEIFENHKRPSSRRATESCWRWRSCRRRRRGWVPTASLRTTWPTPTCCSTTAWRCSTWRCSSLGSTRLNLSSTALPFPLVRSHNLTPEVVATVATP